MRGDYAIILDMDGVLMRTDRLHAKAWEETFNEFLREAGGNSRKKTFTAADYYRFLDGKTRYDGIKSFLTSLSMALPEDGPPGQDDLTSILGIGQRKEEHFQILLSERGVMVYPDSVELLKKWTNQHVPLAVVSSSASCQSLLKRGNLEIFFDVIVDPQLADKHGLKGKPAPDYFLGAAELLGYPPEQCIVVEDSEAGIRAAKAAGFFRVYGMVREKGAGREQALLQAGADRIIHGLAEVSTEEEIFDGPMDAAL